MDISLNEESGMIIERLSQNLSISQILDEYSKLDHIRNRKWRLTSTERDILDKTYRAIDAALEKAKAAHFSQKSYPQYLSNFCAQAGAPSFNKIPVSAGVLSSHSQNRPQTQDTAKLGSYPRFGSENYPFRHTAPGQECIELPYSTPAQLVNWSLTYNCLKKSPVEKPATSDNFTQNHVERQVPCPHYSEHQPQILQRKKRFNGIERPTEAPESQSVSENDRLVEFVAKLTESQIKEEQLRKQEKENSRNLENISRRLDSTTLALRTEENVAKMQAKEIEMLRKTNNQLNRKTVDLIAEAEVVSFAFYENTRLVDKQCLEIADLKKKCDFLRRENEEWKRKYHSTTEQDALSMEQLQDVLKSVLINNDQIIENLKGIQKDPEEKKKMMVDHNRTLQLLRDHEKLNLRVRELEKQLKENDDLKLSDYDLCDAIDD